MPDKPSFLRYDYSSVINSEYGLSQTSIDELAPQLESIRDEIFSVDMAAFADGKLELPGKSPLDTGFISLPTRMLESYGAKRSQSELGQILNVAKQLGETVGRVVVLGIGGSYMGAKALMEACCHPFHNELSDGQRGSRPRVYFEGNNVDNDAVAGLLDLLPTQSTASDPTSRWAIIVISKSGGTLETAAAFRTFLAALSRANEDTPDAISQLVVPVTGQDGKLAELAKKLDCASVFRVPDGVGGRFSILSPVGLLPAAVLGLDVVQLLKGAAQMTDHFRTQPAAENIVMQYTAVSHLAEVKRDARIRVLQVWSKTLESLGLWYDQLLAESLGKDERGATPLTVVNTRDLHSRAQQHQEGRRDKIYTNLIVDQWRRDAVKISKSQHNEDDLNQVAGQSLPDIMSAAIKGTNKAYNDDGRPTANLHLPKVDEFHLGQFLQMMMLATVIEGRLMGVNPYGQPGVEAYKKNMKAELGMS